jgi:hypothetical protein
MNSSAGLIYDFLIKNNLFDEPGVHVVITIFGDNFFFLKTNVMINFLNKLAVF